MHRYELLSSLNLRTPHDSHLTLSFSQHALVGIRLSMRKIQLVFSILHMLIVLYNLSFLEANLRLQALVQLSYLLTFLI